MTTPPASTTTTTLRQCTPDSLLDEAIAQDLLEGYVKADGWTFLYIDGHTLRLADGQLVPFLVGMLGIVPQTGRRFLTLAGAR